MGSARDKRRQQKLAKQKKRRDTKRRPGRDQPAHQVVSDPSRGLEWPVGPCFVSDGWHERGAQVDVLISRVTSEGQAIAASFQVDLAEQGITAASLRGGLRTEHLSGEAARMSDASDRAMLDIAPPQAAAVVAAARGLGAEGISADALSILDGIDLDAAPIEVLVGPPDAPPPPTPEGWFSRLVGRIVGAP